MGILGSFLGTDQRKDLAASKAQSDAQLSQGYGSANADYTKAVNNYQPYVDQGQQGISDNNYYRTLLGLNGTGARDTAEGQVTSDPMFGGQVAQQSNALLRNLNARGQSGGGMAALAGARIAPSIYQDYLNRFQQNGQQGVQNGLQATGAQSNAMQGRGQLAYGYGATQAGNSINYGNAMAANDSTGVNNLLKVAQIAASAVGGGGLGGFGGGSAAAGNLNTSNGPSGAASSWPSYRSS